ncbi:4F2 cell-surface antigen heavy chain [Heterocephalus glaber]|uniref:4F2 cell-surface antigen heavy chain n=1 Tax=Heterocephalus glaber TaxID=10181 RepID=G5AYJ7_HETGA|nr:4F2 cell-surface antigen heavy chain [Heterocephalus glaber]
MGTTKKPYSAKRSSARSPAAMDPTEPELPGDAQALRPPPIVPSEADTQGRSAGGDSALTLLALVPLGTAHTAAKPSLTALCFGSQLWKCRPLKVCMAWAVPQRPVVGLWEAAEGITRPVWSHGGFEVLCLRGELAPACASGAHTGVRASGGSPEICRLLQGQLLTVLAVPCGPWWHRGPLYYVGDAHAFQGGAGHLADLRERLDYLSALKVKGLVLGPIHKNRKDDLAGTDLQLIDSTLGSREDFDSLLLAAKKKSIHVVLDLTPNYQGQNSWFLPTQVNDTAAKVKEALSFWLEGGVDGFQVRDVEKLKDAPSFLAEWENITKSSSKDRLFIAGTNSSNMQQLLSLLESTQDVLLTSSYLSSPSPTGEHMKFLVNQYLNISAGRWCSWSVSQAGLLTSFVPSQLLRLYQLLLFTLPGTPVFSYGDELGLQAASLPGQPAQAPVMPWDTSSLPDASGSVGANMTVKSQSEDPASLLSLFRRLSDQRGKERSLLHGDFHALSAPPGLFSYVRHWDQNERFLVVLNFGDLRQSATLGASGLPATASLPPQANLLLSTHPGRKEGASLELGALSLEAHEGLLLHFPYEP